MIKKIRKYCLLLLNFLVVFILLSLSYSIYSGFNDTEVPLKFTYNITKCNEQKVKYDNGKLELLNIKKENNIFLLSGRFKFEVQRTQI